MKRFLVAMSIAIGLLGFVALARASVTTVKFTDEEAPGVICCGLVNSAAWASFGLTVNNAYWYADGRDTFDGEGLSVFRGTPGTGVVTLDDVSPGVTVDYWSIGGHAVTVSAYDVAHMLLGSAGVGGPVDAFGTASFPGNVKFVEWSGDEGFAQISTLRFERAMVPEPATLALLGVGLDGLGFLRRKQ